MSATSATLGVLDEQKRGVAEVALALGVVLIVALLIVPLPPFMLDLFLATSIAASLVVLLIALGAREPLEFSAFPAVLLLLTLFRLALNVSTTRLILGRGEAGQVVHAFGEFVIGGNYAVGLVIFLILIAINFVVITKGAGRVAEVAARFTLDAMPGKQMAIDADLAAGMIDEREARRRRDSVAREAEFYGAMDGSSKFVKGDAVAGLLITAINIVGGIFIGVVQRDLPLAKALSQYTVLTVGDGLVTQIPALVISTAAGFMVTHAAGGRRMGETLASQLGAHPRALWITAAVITAFAFVPGLPAFPFLVLGLTCAFAARSVAVKQALAIVTDSAPSDASSSGVIDPLQEMLQLDVVEMEVGYAVIPLADERQGGELLERVQLLRKESALELGVLIPPIRIRDDLRLPANEYVLRIRGVEAGRNEVLPRFVLAIDTGTVLQQIEGIDARDPSFGMPARWIDPARRMDAETNGYVVVEPSTVIATHLMELLKQHAADLLGRQDVQEMIGVLRKSHPALVDDIVPARLQLGTLHRVLQRLLRERVPVRDLVTILEALGDVADQIKDVDALTEHTRRALGPTISRLHADEAGVVRGITIGPRLEAALLSLFGPRQSGVAPMALHPMLIAQLLRDLNTLASSQAQNGKWPPLITPPGLRVGIRRIVEPVMPTLSVISLAELPATATLTAVGTWEMPGADVAPVALEMSA